MHACGAKGNCTTCKFKVTKGAENVIELTDSEIKFKNAGRLEAGERLACQAIAEDSIEIEVPEKCKLPHMDYSY